MEIVLTGRDIGWMICMGGIVLFFIGLGIFSVAHGWYCKWKNRKINK